MASIPQQLLCLIPSRSVATILRNSSAFLWPFLSYCAANWERLQKNGLKESREELYVHSSSKSNNGLQMFQLQIKSFQFVKYKAISTWQNLKWQQWHPQHRALQPEASAHSGAMCGGAQRPPRLRFAEIVLASGLFSLRATTSIWRSMLILCLINQCMGNGKEHTHWGRRGSSPADLGHLFIKNRL